MIRRGKRQAQPPVTMLERFAQAYRAGEVRLDSFSPAELDSVALDPDAVLPEARGPALQAAGRLLSELQSGQNGLTGASAAPGRTPPGLSAGDPAAAALAQAAAALESRGYLRPGTPDPPQDNVPPEFAGWSADPDGPGLRRVALSGDLGVITRMRAQPYWVIEASGSAEPANPDPVAAPWRLTGRMYAAYRPQAALTEVPGGRDGAPGFAVLWQQRAVLALVTWCGIELDELRDTEHCAFAEPLPDVRTADVAGSFATVSRLRIAHPLGSQVLVRTLVSASAGGRHWLLQGERAELASLVSVNQLGERIDALIQPPGGPDTPAGQ